MVKTALYVHMEAKPGKEAEVQKFLEDGLALVNHSYQLRYLLRRLGGAGRGDHDLLMHARNAEGDFAPLS